MEVVENCLRLFKIVTKLNQENKQISNYCILLEKILNMDKKAALAGPVYSMEKFLKVNKDSLMESPLALYNYMFDWVNPISMKTVYEIDLMPAFAGADPNQLAYMHYYILSAAYYIFDKEQDRLKYFDKREEIKKMFLLDESCDKETQVVEKLFDNLENNLDKGDFLKNFMTSITNESLDFKKLFKELWKKIDELAKKQKEPNPAVDSFLKEIKDCDFEFSNLSPLKLISILSKISSLEKSLGGDLLSKDDASSLSLAFSNKCSLTDNSCLVEEKHN
jgi:hypothetical protein